MLNLDPTRQGSPPKHAATALLVRDGAEGLEIFCVERSRHSRFLGGAIVFPGGKVDEDDGHPAWAAHATAPRAPRSADFAAGDSLRSLAVAACRESLEEAALLPTDDPTLTDAEVLGMRAALAAGASLRALLAARQVRLDLGALRPFARWLTPVAEARRFDARFFLARAPAGQRGAHDANETMASFWAPPADVLARFDRGGLQLAPPTHRCLEILTAARDVENALAIADAACLAPICPELVEESTPDGTARTLTLPGDPQHSVRDLRCPGRTRYVLHAGRWMPADPPRTAR